MFNWLHQKQDGEYIDVLIEHQARSLNIAELAIDKAIDMIAKMVSKSEFRVYRKNSENKIVETKDHVYFLLNIRPNPNETGTEFWKCVVKRLMRSGECVVVKIADSIYIADNFTESKGILFDRIYSNITIGDLHLDRTFTASEVLHLRNKNKKILNLMRAFEMAYADMLATAIGNYKISNSPKFRMKLPSQAKLTKDDGTITTKNEYARELEKELTSEEIKVIIAGESVDLSSIDKGTSKNIEDIIKLTQHIFELVAFLFDIPVDVFIGKTTEKSNAMNDFITFSISDIAEIINDSINAKWVGEDDFVNGECIELDQSSFKHVDILDVATNLDKLFADGFSHNDLRKFTGLHYLDEDWANEHNVTKNYAKVEGGEKEDEEVLSA